MYDLDDAWVKLCRLTREVWTLGCLMYYYLISFLLEAFRFGCEPRTLTAKPCSAKNRLRQGQPRFIKVIHQMRKVQSSFIKHLWPWILFFPSNYKLKTSSYTVQILYITPCCSAHSCTHKLSGTESWDNRVWPYLNSISELIFWKLCDSWKGAALVCKILLLIRWIGN